jgi:hypothetical protein
MDATLNALHQAQFSWTDVLRRAQGDAFEALGLGPNECPYRVVRLRRTILVQTKLARHNARVEAARANANGIQIPTMDPGRRPTGGRVY